MLKTGPTLTHHISQPNRWPSKSGRTLKEGVYHCGCWATDKIKQIKRPTLREESWSLNLKWQQGNKQTSVGLMMMTLMLTCLPCSTPEPGSGSSSHSPPTLLLWIPPSLAWVDPTESFRCWWTGGRSGTDDPRPLTPGRAGCRGWKLAWRRESASRWKLITFLMRRTTNWNWWCTCVAKPNGLHDHRKSLPTLFPGLLSGRVPQVFLQGDLWLNQILWYLQDKHVLIHASLSWW